SVDDLDSVRRDAVQRLQIYSRAEGPGPRDDIHRPGISPSRCRPVVERSADYYIADAIAGHIPYGNRRSEQIAGCLTDERENARRMFCGIHRSGVVTIAQVDIDLSVILSAVGAAGIHLAEGDVSPAVPVDVSCRNGQPDIAAAIGAAIQYEQAVLVWVLRVDGESDPGAVGRRR